MCSGQNIYLNLAAFKEFVEHQLYLIVLSIQKSFTHVFFPAPPQFVAALTPATAPHGVCGCGAGAPGESAGGSAADLFPMGCTQRRRLVPAWRCHYWWALQSALQASTDNSQLYPPTEPQALHWVKLKRQFFFVLSNKMHCALLLSLLSKHQSSIITPAFCLMYCTYHLISVFRLQTLPLQYLYAMVFALEEINHSPTLLPGLKLGYHIRDSCALPTWAMRGAMTLVGGESAACDSEAQPDFSVEPGEERDKERGASRYVNNKKVTLLGKILGTDVMLGAGCAIF